MSSKYPGTTDNIPFWSKLSIALSSLCVVHCLTTPLVLLFLPAISTFFSETVEQILVLSVVPISLAGFIPTWLRHKNFLLMGGYIFSICLILFSQFALHIHHDPSSAEALPLTSWLSTIITFAGALLLAWVIFKNNRHTHYCTHPEHHQDQARFRPEPLHKEHSS